MLSREIHIRYRFFFILFSLGVEVCSGAPNPAQPGIKLCFESSLTKVFMDAAPPDGKPDWEIAIARGERESFQFLLTAEKNDLRNVRVGHIDSKRNKLDVKLSLVAHVKTATDDPRPWAKTEGAGRIGWWPDPLLTNRPFDLEAGNTQSVWITVFAPPGTPVGKYPGKLKVDLGNGKVREANFRVDVLNVDLPSQQHFRNASFMPPGNLSAHYQQDLQSSTFERMYKQWTRMAFDQHLGPAFDMLMGWNQIEVRSPTTSGPLGPTEQMLLKRDGTHLVWPMLGTKGKYDFRLVDELRALGDEYGLRQFAIAIFSKNETWAQHTARMKDDMADYLKAYSSHLRDRGLLNRAYVYNVDEPPEDQWDTVRNNYRFVKSVVPDLNTWLCLNQPKAVRELQSYTDILDVYIRQYDKAGVEAIQRKGKQIIWATCVWPHEHPNLFIEYPAADARAIGWLTYRYGISGFEYWGLNQWGTNTGRRDWVNFTGGDTRTTWQRGSTFPWGDGWLLYPGKDGEPLSSIRFENLRDGFEDAEMLQILAERGKKKEADQLASQMAASIESYVSDPEKFAGAHRRLLQLLSQ